MPWKFQGFFLFKDFKNMLMFKLNEILNFVAHKMLKIFLGLLLFLWLGVHYHIVTGIYYGLSGTSDDVVLEEGEIDYENMSPEELKKAFEALQKKQQQELKK